ncbi:unnamed protein product [Lactuca saligna]|uniref:Uncharacterized protein n=1 Tax=Lactuca saligna TaxID=75948 RepID=A0AA35UTI6_LACSI|nr:unnamed protein product [Lactuca saligna]
MARLTKYMCLVIFIFLMCEDSFAQGEYNLTIHQEASSAPHEWNVAIENTTPCVIFDAKLDCKGFQSGTKIDPKVILNEDDLCIINGGQQINPQESLHFVYSWESEFPFKLVHQSIACS